MPIDENRRFRPMQTEVAGYDKAIPIRALQEEIAAFKQAVEQHRTGEFEPVTFEESALGVVVAATDAAALSVTAWQNLINRKMNEFGALSFCSIDTGDERYLLKRSRFKVRSYGSIGAAWLQLMAAADGDQQLGVCEATDCQNLYEIKPTRRRRRRYCSNKCGLREWRKSNRS